MDFFAHQEQARRNTGRLLIYFMLAVSGVVLSVYLVAALGLGYVQPLDEQGRGGGLWRADLFALTGSATLALIGAGSGLRIALLAAGGGGQVAEMLGGELLSSDTADSHERRLLNVVEEMAIAAGMPVPPVYLLRHERGINAFAAGWKPTDAVIGVTRGCVEQLSRDQLQGVIGHEFSHILHGDMRLNLRIIGLLYGILLISHVGWWIFRISSSSGYRLGLADRSERKGGNPLPLMGLALYAVGWIGVFFGRLIQSAISRQREFLADASAVQFTRNPQGLAEALLRIADWQAGSRLDSPQAPQSAHLFFSNALGGIWTGWLATHPPLLERVERLQPDWQSQHAGEMRRVAEDASSRRHGIGEVVAAELIADPQGVRRMVSLAPGQVTRSVGNPGEPHVEYAEHLLSAIPEPLSMAARQPASAAGLIWALLVQGSQDPQGLADQSLERYLAPAVADEVRSLLPAVARLDRLWRLPLAELAMPALRQLSPTQFRQFAAAMQALIDADQRLSLFELALQKLVARQLGPQGQRAEARFPAYRSVQSLVPALSYLLSALAQAGQKSPAAARAAFARGAEQLPPVQPAVVFQPEAAGQWARVGQALDQLAAATPQVQQQVLRAATECVTADGRTTLDEAELLRTVAVAFDCPLPPFLPDAGAARATAAQV